MMYLWKRYIKVYLDNTKHCSWDYMWCLIWRKLREMSKWSARRKNRTPESKETTDRLVFYNEYILPNSCIMYGQLHILTCNLVKCAIHLVWTCNKSRKSNIKDRHTGCIVTPVSHITLKTAALWHVVSIPRSIAPAGRWDLWLQSEK